jgi:hypothetical protein
MRSLHYVLMLIALLIATISLIGSVLTLREAQSFNDVCEAACAPARGATPIMGGRNVCLCDQGNGAWRRVTPQGLAD